jgi:hypothetical protein
MLQLGRLTRKQGRRQNSFCVLSNTEAEVEFFMSHNESETTDMSSENEQQPKRTPRGQWRKGASGNPSGRPTGARNRSTLMLEELLEEEGTRLMRIVIQQALKGDSRAQRLCLERIYPPRRERLIDLTLPDVKTAGDASAALSLILSAVGNGQVTPVEGEILTGMVETHKRVIQADGLERRVAELEERLQKKKEGTPR